MILTDTRTQSMHLLGEYSDLPQLLPTTKRDFCNNPPQPPFDWPLTLIAAIKDIINKPCNTPNCQSSTSSFQAKQLCTT
jgi:hypothetical protein